MGTTYEEFLKDTWNTVARRVQDAKIKAKLAKDAREVLGLISEHEHWLEQLAQDEEFCRTSEEFQREFAEWMEKDAEFQETGAKIRVKVEQHEERYHNCPLRLEIYRKRRMRIDKWLLENRPKRPEPPKRQGPVNPDEWFYPWYADSQREMTEEQKTLRDYFLLTVVHDGYAFYNCRGAAQYILIDPNAPHPYVRDLYWRIEKDPAYEPMVQSVLRRVEAQLQPANDTGAEPLSKKARLIYENLKTLESHEAMTLPEIQDWLYDEHEINLDEGTWKKIRKELEPYGLTNKPRIGYFIKK